MVILHNGWELHSWEMRHSPKHFGEITSLFSASCPFGKLSIRQNVRSAKRPFGKMSVRQNVFRQNIFRQNVFRQSVSRQNVRVYQYLSSQNVNGFIKCNFCAIFWIHELVYHHVGQLDESMKQLWWTAIKPVYFVVCNKQQNKQALCSRIYLVTEFKYLSFIYSSKKPFSDVIFPKTHTALALQDSHAMPKGN